MTRRYEASIVRTYVYPPIPDRKMDWCAYRDGYEERGAGTYGWGRTDEEAVADLLAIEESEKIDAAMDEMTRREMETT